MQLLAHPFRLLPNGSAATVTDGTDDAYGQEIALMVATVKGERELAPTYGLTDPTYDEIDAAELDAALAVFCPILRVVDLSSRPVTDTRSEVTITWEVRSNGD